MSWLENNPLGVALAGLCGILVAVALALTVIWSGPVEPDPDGEAGSGEPPGLAAHRAIELGPVSEYQVVNDRPVFNESRRPTVAIADEGEAIELEEAEVAEAPSVRLTGVVITPDLRMVTLSPIKEGKPLFVREGGPLEGEYVGWSVSEVRPRGARLESSEGESLALDLTVYDEKIAEPPKPEPVREASPEAAADEESAENLTRAEEIRRRIQERREQLRAEAAEEQEQAQAEDADKRNQYQEAIRAMMSRDRNAKDEEDESE